MVKKAAHATPNLLLRAARKERGWTQQQVADRIGAALSLNISRWENGTAFPSAYYLEQLCHLFGKNVRELGLSQLEDEMHGEKTSADEADQIRSQTDARMWMVSYPRNRFFLGREEVLAQLRRQFLAAQTMDFCHPQAVSGLGGIGKTQIVLEYAYRHAQDYKAVFWIRADSRETLVAGFLEIANIVDLPERDERDQRIMMMAVKSWLSQHTDWLLILDNADELTFLPEFLPTPMQGHLLLTTRAQALGQLAHRVEINALNQDAAALLVLHRAGLLTLDASLAQAEQTDRQMAEELSRQLGGLPLALDQAGAYLEETRDSLQHYLDLYKSHRAELLRHRGGLALDHPDSVATTWSLSFASIAQQDALAADVLRVCSLLHPDAIPEELFLQGAAHLGPVLSTIETDPLAFNNALAVIQSYSLLRRSSREQTLSMHRVVQAVLADAMSNQERDQWTNRVIAVLNALFPEVRHQVWGQWDQCGRLLSHVLTVVAANVTQQCSLELASLLTKTADYLLQRAQYQQAEPLYQRALSIYERMLSNEHPQVAFPLNGLADLYREQSRHAEAEPLYQRALSLWETLALEYPEIPSPLNNMACLYLGQGRYEQAEPLLQRDLHFKEQTFGSLHPKIASSLNNLAILYCEQGSYERAEPLLQRALHLDEQTFSPEHPETAFSLDNLACLYLDLGRYEQAESLYQRALHIREQMLGSDHPQTAETLHDFARLQELRNQLEEALALYQQALAIREQRLGQDHPRTRDTRTRYTHLLRTCGRTEEAAILETTFARSASASNQEPVQLQL